MAPNPRKVIKYNAYWNVNYNRGGIYLKFQDEGELHWKSEDKAEYTIILQILQNDETPYLYDKGIFATGPEDPGFDIEPE